MGYYYSLVMGKCLMTFKALHREGIFQQEKEEWEKERKKGHEEGGEMKFWSIRKGKFAPVTR